MPSFVSDVRSSVPQMMSSTSAFNPFDDDDRQPIIRTRVERQHFLHPAKDNRVCPRLPISHSTSDILDIELSLMNPMTGETKSSSPNLSKSSSRTKRLPSDIRLVLYPDTDLKVYENLTFSQSEISKPTHSNDLRSSDPSLVAGKSLKQRHVDFIRRTFLEHPVRPSDAFLVLHVHCLAFEHPSPVHPAPLSASARRSSVAPFQVAHRSSSSPRHCHDERVVRTHETRRARRSLDQSA